MPQVCLLLCVAWMRITITGRVAVIPGGGGGNCMSLQLPMQATDGCSKVNMYKNGTDSRVKPRVPCTEWLVGTM
jgi:hypothetical protein